GGDNPPNQSVNVSISGAALTFTTKALTESGNWLAVSPASGTTPGNLSVSVNPSGLAAGTYRGAITITPSGATASLQSIAVTLTVSAAGVPIFSSNGLVNASGRQTKLAPGALFAITGSSVGPDVPVTATAPDYPTVLGGTSITFTPADGSAPVDARIKSASAG